MAQQVSDEDDKETPGMRELISLRIGDWHEVGKHLGLHRHELQDIAERNQHDPRSCKKAMFGLWCRSANNRNRLAVAHALFASNDSRTAKEYCRQHGIIEEEAHKFTGSPVESKHSLGHFTVVVSGRGEIMVPLIEHILNVEQTGQLKRFEDDLNRLRPFLCSNQWEQVLQEIDYLSPDCIMKKYVDVGEVPEVRQLVPLLLGQISFHVVSFDALNGLNFRVRSLNDALNYEPSEQLRDVLLQSIVSVSNELALTNEVPSPQTIVVATCDQSSSGMLEMADAVVRKCLQTCEPYLSGSPVKHCGSRKVVFPYNTLEDDNRSHIKSVMVRALRQHQNESEIPLTWHKFILICSKRGGILEVHQCRDLAMLCEIPETDFLSVLKYAHRHYSSPLYYADIPGMNGIVICDAKLLFRSLNEFVTKTVAASPSIRSTGGISESCVRIICAEQTRSEDDIPYPYLLELLKHFSFASLHRSTDGESDNTYFMPFLLQPEPHSLVSSQNLLQLCPAPLLLRFSKDLTPAYLFPMLVTHLSHIWPVFPENRWKNRVLYLADSSSHTIVELMQHIDSIEIRLYSRSPMHVSAIARSTLKRCFHYISQLKCTSKPQECHVFFYCPESLRINVKLHYAKATGSSHPQLQCQHVPPCVKHPIDFGPEHLAWVDETSTNRLSSLSLEVIDTSVGSTEEKMEMEVFKGHLANQDTINMRVVKCVLYGQPRVGKTSTRKRLTGEIMNLQSLSPSLSTGIEKPSTVQLCHNKTQHASLLLSDPKQAWEPQSVDSQLKTLVQRVLGLNISSSAESSAVSAGFSRYGRWSGHQPSTHVVAPQGMATGSTAMDAQQMHAHSQSTPDLPFPSGAVLPPSTVQGSSSSDMPLSPPATPNLKPLPEFVQEIIKSHSWKEIKKAFSGLEDITIMHITDTGGQPEFQDVLPALIEGSALYLIFLNLAQNLDELIDITYQGKEGKSDVCYKSQSTTKEMLHQVLAGIASSGSTSDDSPAALLIGTHLDQVSPDDVSSLDSALQECLLPADFLRCDLVKTFTVGDRQDSIVFPVDNLNRSSTDIQQLRDLLLKTVELHFKHLALPISHMLFHLVIRQQYEEDPGLCTMEQCQEVASACGISEDDIPQVLDFLHKNFGTILYYPSVPSMQDLIICDPNVLFEPITRLIVESFGANPGRRHGSERVRRTGEISMNIIKEASARSKSSSLSFEQILELLEHRNIISQLKKHDGTTAYFMPCLLRPDPLASQIDKEALLSLDPSPLIIDFSTGYVPMGFFPALVVKLSQYNNWDIEDGERYKGRVAFIIDRKTLVRVEVRSNRSNLEFRVEKARPETCQAYCVRVLGEVTHALEEVKQTLAHTKQITHQVGFYCPQSFSSLHIALCMDTKCPERMRCSCPSKICDVLPRHGVWFPEYQEPMEVDSTLTTANNAPTITSGNASGPLQQCQLSDPPILSDFVENVAVMIPSKWRAVAVALRVPANELDSFEKRFGLDPMRCYEQVFRSWEKSSSEVLPFKWCSVVSVLRTRTVAENALANDLSRKMSINS